MVLDQILLNVELNFFILRANLWDFTNPWMIEKIVDACSLKLVSFKALKNEIFSIWWNIFPLSLWKSNIFITNIFIDPLNIFGIEWSLTRQELISDDTQAPYINFLRVFLMLDELRGHI